MTITICSGLIVFPQKLIVLQTGEIVQSPRWIGFEPS